MVSSVHVEPVSRTDQYKRVMKPMLERKRRARINRCLDELRDLLVAALQAEGETVTRLEKADILELTVRHVRRLNQRRALTLPPASHDPRHDAIKFQQGFVAAAQQVQSFLISSPALEPSVSSRLITHLSSCASAMSGVNTSGPTQAGAPTPSANESFSATRGSTQSPPHLCSRPLPPRDGARCLAAHVPTAPHGPQYEARPEARRPNAHQRD
ncbi:LOW QUALITY PROTEIN: enhancer of split mbeta protein-like [Scylla paramamosain]|uniref:LOW QUALITY PROTEIN: enhancer of split mbeta protein-like n=1 Tax=Scylla paramamosain TaxID=85552 RepID=UPI003083081E